MTLYQKKIAIILSKKKHWRKKNENIRNFGKIN